jgi:hypothetical protein
VTITGHSLAAGLQLLLEHFLPGRGNRQSQGLLHGINSVPVTAEPFQIILTVQSKELSVGRRIELAMVEIIMASLVVLSVGILVAHALDAFRS